MRWCHLVKNVARPQSSNETQSPVAEDIIVGETSNVEVGDAGVYLTQRATTETGGSQLENASFEPGDDTRFKTNDKATNIMKALNTTVGATEVFLKPSSVERIGFNITNDFDGKAVL